MKILLKFLTIVLAVLLLAGTASALSLQGDVAIYGFSADNFDWTTIDILPSLNGQITGTGDFSGLSGGITLASFNFVTPTTPAADPLWTDDGFTFVLDTVLVEVRNDTFLNLKGYGTMSAAGFEDSYGSWALSLNAVGNSLFSFASTTAVPEPGSVLFLGFALFGIAALRQRKFIK